MFWHIDTDLVGLLVMCILYYYTMKMTPSDDNVTRNKGFVWCMRTGIIMTVIDIAASVAMDFPVSRFLYHLFMTAYLLTQNLAIVAWMMYALTIIYSDDEAGRKRVSRAAWTLYAVYSALVLSNPWTGLFFTLGPNLEYARGLGFIPLLVGLYYIYAISLLTLIYVKRKHVPESCPVPVLAMSPVILGIAAPLQLLMPGWLMVYSAYMICLLLAFLFFQDTRVRNERAQLKHLTDTVEHFACGMSICNIEKDNTLLIQYMSSGVAVIYETDVNELRGHMKEDILWGVHPDDKDMVREKLDDMARQHLERQEITFRFVTEAGRLKWINIHAETTENPDGTAVVYATYTDLTELKKAERLIDVALVNTGVSIWEYDFHRKCIIQYQNSTEMHGFERIVPNVPQSLVQSGFVYPESAGDFLEMYDKLYGGAPFAEGVFKVQTSDRKGFWYEHIRYTNAFDENGKPYRAVGMSTDETQRQEAIAKYERELEKEKDFMAEEGLIAHATFDLTTGATLDYRYPDGRDIPDDDKTTFDFVKKNSGLLIDETERARYLELYSVDKLLNSFEHGETEFRLEYRRLLPNGMVTWVRNTMRLLRDPRSGDILLFAYWYDIESEKMLELMYRSLANDNYDFVARIDGRTRHFVAIAKAELSYHLPPQKGDDADAVTMTLYDECVDERDRQMAIDNSLIDNVREHLKDNKRFVFTYRMTRPDAGMRYKKVTQYYIDPQREIIVMLREDITDVIRDQAEKSRVLSEALEDANQASRAKSLFLSRVSHELRTPLNAIIGFMELAKDADAGQIAGYIANSDAAAKQLLAIINDVLDVSSIESGKLKIAHAPFDLKRLIANITDIHFSQCRQKGLEYETMLLTPIDEWLMGDQLRVNQILLNLLNNAVKFTSVGHVWLKIRQLPAQNNKIIIRFEVCDTGCGMSEEMRERLFKPFEQESAATAQKYGGNGLGLSIVGSLVSMMDGVVSVQSKRGEGSTFTVDIPFIKCKYEAPTGMIKDVNSLRVLCIDDTQTEREYVSAVLERLNVRHLCVPDVARAISELDKASDEKDDYNICLIDWKMPDMNGLEATRRIRKKYGPNLILIVVSAYDHYQADETVKAAGANMFISKPLFQSSLFDLFATLTDGRIAQRRQTRSQFDLKDMRILIVEDNAMNRIIAQTLIERKFGASCECAQDGQIALDMFLASPKGKYDAILMDIQMPNMDGYEATKRIRASAHPDAKDVQILALTANAFREDVTRSLSCGMNAHISKPIEPNVLGGALEHAFKQRRGKE